MEAFTAQTLAGRVRQQIGATAPRRLAEVTRLALHHLHAFVREARPTEAEWLAAIRFLTETGQVSTDQRNDFILMSDLFGISALVDLINHEGPDRGVSESTVLGPFFVEGAPELEHGAIVADLATGEPAVVEGRVLNRSGIPVAEAMIDVWQTDGTGEYDVQHDQPGGRTRGQFRSGADGGFWFRTVKPVSYPVPTDGPVGVLHTALGRPVTRPAHLHFMIRAKGYRPLTTHLFVAGDPHLPSDPVFGVKPSLIVPFERLEDKAAATGWQVASPFYHLRHDFRLADSAGQGAAR
jgi:hydroxyquinol 1,2-dioxygenase